MKLTLTLTIIFISGILTLNAQKVENIKVTGNEYQEFMANNQYKFPSYTRAKIVLKNGEVASARINYNNFSEVMKYLNEKNDTLEIANPDDINFITVGVDTIFYDNGYYQWIASSSAARLYSKTTYKTVGTALVGAFGTASPATNIQHMNIISSYNTIFNLAANEVVTFEKSTSYYISPLNGSKGKIIVANKTNLHKLFPKKDIETFIKDNRMNMNKEEDLIDLMVYIGKEKKQ